MLDKLIAFIAEGSEERFNEISLEDAALAHAWCAARKGDENSAAVQVQLDAWLEKHRRAQWDTEGHRHQWVLRDLIDEVQAGRLPEFERGELDFLCLAFELAGRIEDGAAYGRVRSLLQPFVNEIEVRRRELPSCRGLKALEKRIRFLDSADLENAPPARVRTIAGIEMPSTGPLLKHSGHVKLLGSIPDDCTLVVEGGCCSIMGYVMGRLAATRDCDVRHNISGVIISSLGSIRARNIIDQAFVVAKAGSIRVRRIENPRLLFAGERLVVTDSVRRGKIIAPDIDIHNQVLGGCIHVSRCLSGNRFRATPDLPVEIVFRQRLSNTDFGGVRTRDAARLWSEVLRLKTRILTLESLIQSMQREVKHHAETALFFLCSDRMSEKHAEGIRRNKSRLEVIERIIEGLLDMAHAIAERAAQRAAVHAETGNPRHADEAAVMFRVAETILQELDRTTTGESDVQAFIGRMSEIRDDFRCGVPGSRLAATSLARIREELARWLKERHKLTAQISQSEATLRAQMNWGELAPSAADMDAPERFLERILETARRQPDSPIARKAALPFVSAMGRAAEKRLQTIKDYQKEMLDKRNEFEHKARDLRVQYQVTVALDEADSSEGPRVTGRFEGGVVIYADVPAWEQGDTADDARLLVLDTGDTFKTYRRHFAQIVEAKP